MIRQIFLRFLRDPLFHFLVLGAALFMVYSTVNGTAVAPAEQIVVDETQALRLADQFQRTWMRLPTRQELQGLAEDFVKEEKRTPCCRRTTSLPITKPGTVPI